MVIVVIVVIILVIVVVIVCHRGFHCLPLFVRHRHGYNLVGFESTKSNQTNKQTNKQTNNQALAIICLAKFSSLLDIL